jgi:DNA-binding NarL/FixJ family response regulator
MTGPEGFFDRIDRDLEQIKRLLEAAGDALAERIEEGTRALVPLSDPGNPENPPRRPGQPRRVDWDEALRLYEQGWSNAQIAEQFGVTPFYISRLLHRMGVRRTRGSPSRVPREEVIRLHHDRLSPREIAAQVGLTEMRVYQVLQEEELTPHRLPSAREIEAVRQREQVLELHHQGLSALDIIQQAGASQGFVYRVLREEGLRPNRPARTDTARERHIEIVRMHQGGMTNRQIARELGITDAAVSAHLRDLRPDVPPPSDFEFRAASLLPQVETLRTNQSEANIRRVEILLRNLEVDAGEYVVQLGLARVAEDARWRVAFVRERVRRAIEELATLRGCLAQMDYARDVGLPRLIQRAEGCIERAIELVRQCCPELPLPTPV